jgi:hypothetical protein
VVVDRFAWIGIGRTGFQFGDRSEKPILLAGVKQFLPVKGNLERRNSAQDLFGLALLGGEPPERAYRRG